MELQRCALFLFRSGEFEERLRLEPQQPRQDIARKHSNPPVVVADRGVVVTPRSADRRLNAPQIQFERLELLGCAQFRVFFRHGEQMTHRSRQLVLSRDAAFVECHSAQRANAISEEGGSVYTLRIRKSKMGIPNKVCL